MQKLRLTDGTFVENVIDINNFDNKDELGRAVLNITVTNTTYAEVIEKFQNGNALLENIEVYSNVVGVDEHNQPIISEEYIFQGNHISFTEYNGITRALPDGATFQVQMIQDSAVAQLHATVKLQADIIIQQRIEFEQRLLESQLALAELGQIVGSVM